MAGLKDLLDRLSTIHVFHWTVDKTVNPSKNVRHPLLDGIDRWGKYVDLINANGRDLYMLLEFVKNDSPEQVIADAKILKELTSK